MTSDKQTEANRANAQKSTGPRSPSGKSRSRLNALRHGLSGQVVVLPGEDLAAFNVFVAGILDDLKPANNIERQLAQSYANCQWRLNRAAAIENNLFSLGLMEDVGESLDIEHPEAHTAMSNAKTFRLDALQFEKITLYSHRLVNQAAKVLKELRQLQDERKQLQAAQLQRAAIIRATHLEHHATFDPRANGFEFSREELDTHVHRENLTNSHYVRAWLKQTAAHAA